MAIRYDYVLHHVSVQGQPRITERTGGSIQAALINCEMAGENRKSGIAAMRATDAMSPANVLLARQEDLCARISLGPRNRRIQPDRFPLLVRFQQETGTGCSR